LEKKKHPDFKKLSDTKFVIPVYKKFLKVFDVPSTEVFESEFLKKVHVAKKLDFKNALKKILSPIKREMELHSDGYPSYRSLSSPVWHLGKRIEEYNTNKVRYGWNERRHPIWSFISNKIPEITFFVGSPFFYLPTFKQLYEKLDKHEFEHLEDLIHEYESQYNSLTQQFEEIWIELKEEFMLDIFLDIDKKSREIKIEEKRKQNPFILEISLVKMKTKNTM